MGKASASTDSLNLQVKGKSISHDASATLIAAMLQLGCYTAILRSDSWMGMLLADMSRCAMMPSALKVQCSLP